MAQNNVLLEAQAKFRKIMEYIEPNSMLSLNEDGEDDMMAGGDPNAAMGANMPPEGMGGEMPADGMGNTGMDGGMPMPESPEGFDPQGPEQPLGGSEPNAIGGDPNAAEEETDEVIDVDDLTKSQEATETKVDKILSKFDQMDDKVFAALDKVATMVAKSNKRISDLETKMDERLPDDEQKIELRSQKSGPYYQSVENYWQTQAPKNYSIEDDESKPTEYKITKNDIDSATDYGSIYKSFDEEDEKYGNMTLKDIYNL